MCLVEGRIRRLQGGLVVGEVSSLVRPRTVTGRGEGLASHAGLVWLGEVADVVGLSEGLLTATAGLPWRRHRPGRTLAQMVLALADGADCLSDLKALRDQPALFGPVASQATAWRTFNQLGPGELRGIDDAVAHARAAAWAVDPDGDAVLVVDLDATLVTTHADKQDAAATYKRSFGHHPLWPWTPSGARSWRSCCAPATPGRTPPATMSWSWATPSTRCPPSGGEVTSPTTTPMPTRERSWSGRTRRGRRTCWQRNAESGTARSPSATPAPA